MKITTYLRTTAQLKGMIDEIRAKKNLLITQLHQNPHNVYSISKDLARLEGEMTGINVTLDLVNEELQAV
jgi:hypothetical protein